MGLSNISYLLLGDTETFSQGWYAWHTDYNALCRAMHRVNREHEARELYFASSQTELLLASPMNPFETMPYRGAQNDEKDFLFDSYLCLRSLYNHRV